MSNTSETLSDAIEKYEVIFEARDAVIAELEKEAVAEAKAAGWWTQFWNWCSGALKKIVQITCSLLKSEVLFIINNKENQQLAKIAVMTAWKLGLKSSAAWSAAWTVLMAGQIFIATGVSIPAAKIVTNILETLLQLVYTCLCQKNQNPVLIEEPAKPNAV